MSPRTCGRTASTSTPAGWTRSPSSGSRASAPRCSTASRSNCAAPSNRGTPSARSPPPAAPPATSTRRWNASRCGSSAPTGTATSSPANGYPVPLLATDIPDVQVGGVRFRAWQPPSALHPTITVDGPLRFELVDTATAMSRGGCTYHVSHPGGRSYDDAARQRRGGRVAPGPPLRGDRLHTGPGRHVRHPREAGAPVHRRRRAGHPRSASSAYRSAVTAFLPQAVQPTATVPGAASGYRPTTRPCWPGTAPRGPRQSLFDVRGGAPAPVTTNSSTPQAMSGRPGRSWPNASANVAAAAWTGCARWCGAWSTTTASPTSRSTGTATRSPTATERRCRGRGMLDALPLLISASDWDTLESGLVQRSRLLDAVLTDLYGPRPLDHRRGAARRSCCSPIPATSGPPAASRCPAATSCSCTAAISAEAEPGPSWSTPTGRRRRRARAMRWPTGAWSPTPSPTSTSGSGRGRPRRGRRRCGWR